MVDALVSGTSGSNALEVRVFLSAPSFGVVAQLIERYVRIVEVVGLSPISSTIKIQTPFNRRFYFSRGGTRTHGRGFVPPQKGRREYAGLCFRPFILVFLYQILYNSQCNGGLPLWGLRARYRASEMTIHLQPMWLEGVNILNKRTILYYSS